MQRLYAYNDFAPYACRYEMILAQNLSIVDPELDLARIVSGVLCNNPLYSYGTTDCARQVLEELMSGQKVGCICITERERV